MNLLDENIPEPEAEKLKRYKIRFRQIGRDIASFGDDDRQHIIPLLHRRKNITFFTSDKDFYNRELCHRAYCLVYLDIVQREEAQCIRRLLKHKRFDTTTKRLGKVIRLAPDGIHFWTIETAMRQFEDW